MNVALTNKPLLQQTVSWLDFFVLQPLYKQGLSEKRKPLFENASTRLILSWKNSWQRFSPTLRTSLYMTVSFAVLKSLRSHLSIDDLSS